MLLSYFYPSQINSKVISNELTPIQKAISFPATLSEIDVVTMAFVPSFIAACWSPDTFIGGPSTKFGIFQAVAIHAVISMILQRSGEKQLNKKKLEVSRTSFEPLEKVLEAQFKLDENALSISSTIKEIDANKKLQVSDSRIQEKQRNLDGIKIWLEKHKKTSINLEKIKQYVTFAKGQASRDKEAHEKDVKVQRLQEEVNQLKNDCIPLNAEIKKREILIGKLKKEKEEIEKQNDGMLAKAQAKAIQAKKDFDDVSGSHGREIQDLNTKREELNLTKAKIEYHSKKTYVSNTSSLESTIRNAKKRRADCEHLHELASERLGTLENKASDFGQRKTDLKKEIETLNAELQSLDKDLQKLKDAKKDRNQQNRKAEHARLSKKRSELIKKTEEISAKISNIPNLTLAKSVIGEMERVLGMQQAHLKFLAPDRELLRYKYELGINKLSKEQADDEKAFDEAKKYFDDLETVQKSVDEVIKDRNKKKKDIKSEILTLNSGLSELSQSLKQIDFPKGSEGMSEETLRQAPEGNIDNLISSASTALLESIKTEKKKDTLTKAISIELQGREEQKKPHRKNHTEITQNLTELKRLQFNIDNPKVHPGIKIPNEKELHKLLSDTIVSMTTAQLLDTTTRIASLLDTARIDALEKERKSKASKEKHLTAQTLSASIKALETTITKKKNALSVGANTYRSLESDLCQKTVEIGILDIEIKAVDNPTNDENLGEDNSDSFSEIRALQALKKKEIERKTSVLEGLGISPPEETITPFQNSLPMNWLKLSPEDIKKTIEKSGTHVLKEIKLALVGELIQLETAIINDEAKQQTEQGEIQRLNSEKEARETAIQGLKSQKIAQETALSSSLAKVKHKETKVENASASLAKAEAEVEHLKDRANDLQRQIDGKINEIGEINKGKSRDFGQEIISKTEEQEKLTDESLILRAQISKEETKRSKNIDDLNKAIAHFNEQGIEDYKIIIEQAEKILGYHQNDQRKNQALETAPHNNATSNVGTDLTSERDAIDEIENCIDKLQEAENKLFDDTHTNTERGKELREEIDAHDTDLANKIKGLERTLEGYKSEKEELKSSIEGEARSIGEDRNQVIDLNQSMSSSDYEKSVDTSDARNKSSHKTLAQISSIVTAVIFITFPNTLIRLSGTNRVIVWLLCTVIQQESHQSLDRYIKCNFEG